MQVSTYPLNSNPDWSVPIRSCVLLSVDLEDIRSDAISPGKYKHRVPELVDRYLRFFADQKTKVTWFVVGKVARDDPQVIRALLSEGHEVACHTDDHVHLDKQTRPQFRDNILRNIEALTDAGAKQVIGFRSPCFSLVESTKWAWDVLAENGFTYSSSVLPAKSPLYGWKGFHQNPTRHDNGILELPISITNGVFPKLPFAGGVYLRTLPMPLIRLFCRWYQRRSLPVVSYLHPYDIDPDQERFQVMENAFFDWLMYYNRSSTLSKLNKLMSIFPSSKYDDFVNIVEKGLAHQLPNKLGCKEPQDV